MFGLRLFGAFCVLCLLIFGYACKNPIQQSNSAIETNDTPSSIEKADTPDCSYLVSMASDGSGGWVFSLKNGFLFKRDLKGSVKFNIFKTTPDNAEYDNLTISFLIDSDICVDQGCHVVFNFVDSTKLSMQNYKHNNCIGDYQVTFNHLNNEEDQKKNAARIAKIRNTKIHTIEFETHSGPRNYVLSDVEATNLIYIINCIHKVK